jgi:hypothetical protein
LNSASKWCLHADVETRCPKGSKTILYYHSKLEKFAEYLNQNGLVTRLTIYSDTASMYMQYEWEGQGRGGWEILIA